jgi:hypothetical protein
MNRAFAILWLAFLLAGCASSPVIITQGIPHLLIADSQNNVLRSGQPQNTPETWYYLQSIRSITNAVKLDTEVEGSDSEAAKCGVTIRRFPIPLGQQLFGPHDALMHAAVNAIVPNTIVSCLNGNDRTGVIIALYWLSHGMDKQSAENLMLASGFHKAEFGLWNYWLKQKVEDWLKP